MKNLNDFAVEISKKEGKHVNLPIGQIKEVLKITLQLLKDMKVEEVGEILKKVKSL